METAGEGGAWGIALLADYMKQKQKGETLEQYLNEKVFCEGEEVTIAPSQKDSEGFDKFIALYQKGLAIEKAAVETMKI